MGKDMRVDEGRLAAQGAGHTVGADKYWDVTYGDYTLDRSKKNSSGTLLFNGQPVDPHSIDPSILSHLTGSLKEHKGFFSGLGVVGDVLGFEASNLKTMLGNAKSNPLGLVLGGADAVGNKLWHGLGVDVGKPLVNEWGGPTQQAYQEAAARGINIGPSAMSHQIAQSIAGTIAGGYGLSQLGSAVPALSSGLAKQGVQFLGNQLVGKVAPGIGGYDFNSILGGPVAGPGQSALAPPQMLSSSMGSAFAPPSAFTQGFNAHAAPQASAQQQVSPFEALRQRLRTGTGDYASPNYTPGILASTNRVS